ncbi:MAG: hypothetical protein AAGB16_01005 [Pseudomonadota bacterium]
MADSYDEATAHLRIEFFNDSKEHKRLSAEQKKPVFKDVEMVRIYYLGTKDVHVAPAHAKCHAVSEIGQPSEFITYAQKYDRHYQAWKKSGDNAVQGTPLDEATFLTAAGRSTLKAMNILSIEAVAAMDDQIAKTVGPAALNWRDDAKAFLDAQNSNADIIKMQSEVDLLRAEIAALKGGQEPEPAAPTDEPSAGDIEAANALAPVNEFDGMSASELKDFIKDKTGHRPLGNPAMGTLIKAATEASRAVAA